MKFLKYIVFVLPILFFMFGINFNRAKYSNDPDYIYLVNALAICNGKSVGHIDNPGTTVMQIGAATISITHLLTNTEKQSLTTHVLKNPDKFIEVIRIVVLFINTIFILLLGLFVFKITKSVWIAIALQALLFYSSNTLDHIWTKVSPEPVLLFISCIYVIAILYFYTDANKYKWKYVLIFALITGAGLATKATFLPLVIAPFVFLPSLKKKFIYLLAIIPHFVLFTIPAISEYKSMYNWFHSLVSHSGKYGQGNKGFIDWDTYFPNIIKIVDKNPIFGVILALGIVIILVSLLQSFRRNKPFNWEVKILSGIVASSAFGILLVAKHYHANHYLAPVLLLSGISLFFTFKITSNFTKSTYFNKYFWHVTVGGMLLFLVFLQYPTMKKMNNGYQISNEEIAATNKMVKKDYPNHLCVNYYSFSLNKYTALKFGNAYTKSKFLAPLKEIYPDTFFYDHSKKQFVFWDTEIKLKELIKRYGNKILMVNGPTNEKSIKEMKDNGIFLTNIYKGRVQTIHKVETLQRN